MGDDTRRSAGRSIDDAVWLACSQLSETWQAPTQSQRIGACLEQFAAFARVGYGLDDPELVTAEVAEAFVKSSLGDSSAPSVPLMHLRRLAIRILFRSLRQSGVAVGDPTLDLVLPARSQLKTRPLTDDEVILCRGNAMWSLSDSRRAAAWALAEATCRSMEIGQIRVGDVDLTRGRVWIHGGRTTVKRWGQLNDWGVSQLARRLRVLPAAPETVVVYGGAGSEWTGQISACTAIAEVLTRAGLAAEPDVRPASVAAWAGRQILVETGRIDEVARRLGMASLDRAARFIGFDWRDDS
jgi:integrase